MSPAPDIAIALEGDEDYARGWNAMMDLVTRGHSWSGHERHVMYLNERSGTFANVSFVSGLDAREDGRALGLVDWDGDGDLDVWFRNRTAPRLKLMRNTRGQERSSVVIELEGRTCNRDGIGAVVTLIPESGPPLVRSVRAGDLFLSQGSKRLHFGLGSKGGEGGIREGGIREVRVLWTGGGVEVFAGEMTDGEVYRLVQGSGVAARLEARGLIAEEVDLAPGRLLGEADMGRARVRVRLPVRLPLFPSFHYLDQALQEKALDASGRAKLVMLWSSGCARCREEMPVLREARGDFERAGLEVLSLCVDPVETASAEAYQWVESLDWPYAFGLVEANVLEKMAVFQEALFDRAVPLAVPLGLLLDAESNVLAFYRGRLPVDSVLEDARALLGADAETLHHLAPPFAGRWFTNPVPMSFVAEDLSRRFQERFPEESLPYLHLAFTEAEGQKQETLRLELGYRHRLLAQAEAEANRPQSAVRLFDQALRYTPESAVIHHNFGVLLARYGEWARARERLRQALALDPDSEATRQALEMVERQAAGEDP